MSRNKGKKLAVPRDAAEMQRLEDRIDGILQNIKKIRQGLQDGPIHTVILKLGTFEHYLDFLEPLALEYHSSYENAKKYEEGRRKREEIDAKREANGKNHK